MVPIASEPTLADFLKAVWAARIAVLTGIAVGLAAALLFLALSVPQYRVTMLVAPAERAARTDIKALLPDNPSFALQYLVNTVGSEDSTDFIRFEHILRGPSVAARLLSDEKILAGLRADRKFIFSASADLHNAAGLSAFLEKEITVEPVGNTPLRSVTFEHPEPEFAIMLLTRLYGETDRLIRGEVIARARDRSAYLTEMLEKTDHPDHRRALTSLLMEQEHILMVLAMDEPFSAIIAEPPSASLKPWWPRRSLVFAGFAFAGAMLGYALSRPARLR